MNTEEVLQGPEKKLCPFKSSLQVSWMKYNIIDVNSCSKYVLIIYVIYTFNKLKVEDKLGVIFLVYSGYDSID